MTTGFKCDRCKKFIVNRSCKIRVYESGEHKLPTTNSAYDLCDKCFDLLIKFLSSGSVV